MKNFILAFTIFLASLATGFAQTSQVKPAAQKSSTTKANTAPKKDTVVLKKDGTPDKRFTASKRLKKDGTPDKRYKQNKKSSQ